MALTFSPENFLAAKRRGKGTPNSGRHGMLLRQVRIESKPLQFRRHPTAVRVTPAGLILKYSCTAYLITAWPELQIYQTTSDSHLVPIHEGFRPVILAALNNLRQSSNQAWRLATYDLLRALPFWAHARLVPMREYYWLGLETLARIPESLRLLEASPALFAAVAQYAKTGCLDTELLPTLRTHLSGKQRDLTGWLGFGDHEASCKIMRKLSFYDYAASEWHTLARCMRQDEIRRALQHASVIPDAVVDFLVLAANKRVFAAQGLAEIISEIQRLEPLWIDQREFVDEVLSRGELLRKLNYTSKPLASYAAYKQAWHKFTETMEDIPMPLGPELNLQRVEPIRTVRELKLEATAMKHCAGSLHFVLEGLRGNYCFYRMSNPERMTICLERASSLGGWIVNQIRGLNNCSASDATMTLVRRAVSMAA